MSVEDPAVEVRIVVVENEIGGDAKRVLEGGTGGRFPVEYAVEPTHGIPFARNRAVEVAGDFDFIAFLDDDEWAEPQWLEELLDAQAKSGAQVVFGPVLPEFEAHPPKWLVRSRYFDPLSFEALQEVGFAYTSNVLVSRDAFDSDRPFSEKFAVIGGSDTHFFMRVWLGGGRIVWAPAARVHEAIPRQRMRLGWIARREYRRGTTLSLCLLELEPFRHRKVKRVVHGIGRIAFGAVLALASVVRGRGLFARAAGQAGFSTHAEMNEHGGVATVVQNQVRRTAVAPLEDFMRVIPIVDETLTLDGERRRAGCAGNHGGGMILGRINIARGPAHIGTERLRCYDQNRGLDRHMERSRRCIP